MATRNIVPRATGEGSIGTAAKHWGAGHFDTLPNWQEYLAESTGYGIVSGCEPTISGLTVTVAAGIVHLAGGTRKELSATNITLDSADPTNPRIDIVYITSAGDVAKATGTATASPSAPAVPIGGISVCNVSVAANASTGTVTDSRGMLSRFYNTGIVNVKDFGAKGDGTTDDTAAIQAAIDYAINNGIGMIILSKSYVISAPLVIRNANGLTLFTPDSGCRLIASQNFIGDVNNGDYMIRIHASHHVTIKGIVFICNSIANGVSIANDGDAYTTAYSINIYLQYLNIADPKDNGVDISAGCGYIYLNNVRVHHVSNTPCTFIDVGSRYYRTIGFTPQYIYIYNCQLEGGESEADLTGIKFAACQYAWVRDNDICNMVAGNAILCKPNLDVDGNEQIFIEGNSFFNNATAVFLDCTDKFNDAIQVKNNIIYIKRISDIFVKQINPSEIAHRCFPLEIVGNNITTPTALSPTKYISLEYANQVVISGNSLAATLQTTWQNGISLGNSIMAKYDQFIMSHTDDGYTAQRIGNKVILNINFATANVVDKNTSMLTVNSDYVPKQLVGAGRGMAGDANGVLSNVGVVIDTNGNVYHSSSTPRKTLIATVIYLTD